MRSVTRTTTRFLLSILVTVALTTLSAPASAVDQIKTVEASGSFTFTTNPGILPTWESAGITLAGISPGSVITTTAGLSARIFLPIVAKTGTANAAAGGFRFLNSSTGRSVRCQVPTVDTRARQVDCILTDGTAETLFVITEIAERFKVSDSDSVTTFFRGIDMTFASSESAANLNDALDTNVFSASVSVARGTLEVTRNL